MSLPPRPDERLMQSSSSSCSALRSDQWQPGSGAAASSFSSESLVAGALPPFGNEGPTAQELKQLQRRLEEACHPRSRIFSEESLDGSGGTRASALVPRVTSACSMSTMAGVESSEDSEVQDTLRPQGQIEFSLNIEEGQACTVAQQLEQQQTSWTQQEPQAPVATRSGQSRRSSRFDALDSSHRRCSGSTPPEASEPSSSRAGSPTWDASRSSPARQSNGSVRSAQPWRPLPREYRHSHVPKNMNLAEEFRNNTGKKKDPPTTLMIRNLPNRYTQRELISELEDLGFAGTFDFLYIPLDKGTMSNVGYAFVNFVEPSWAQKCISAFQGYRFKQHRKEMAGKMAAISVAHIQGLEANLAHYEKAAVNTAKLKQRRPLVMANISSSLSGVLSDDN